jgi:hypothetical protein
MQYQNNMKITAAAAAENWALHAKAYLWVSTHQLQNGIH